MSHVTSVIITCPTHEKVIRDPPYWEWIDLVNEFLHEEMDEDNFFKDLLEKKLPDAVAGTKHPQTCLYVGGLNHFNIKQFVKFFESLKWPKATLLIRDENWDDQGHLTFPRTPADDYQIYDLLRDREGNL